MMSLDEAVRFYLRYDHDTGRLFWINRPSNRVKVGAVAGTIRKDGYVMVKVAGQYVLAHRIAWFLCYGRWPDRYLDHIDMNPGNNRIDNLRECTPSQNIFHRRLMPNNTSGFSGVWLDRRRNRWVAEIVHQGTRMHLGSFVSKEIAGAVRQQKAIELFGEFVFSGG